MVSGCLLGMLLVWAILLAFDMAWSACIARTDMLTACAACLRSAFALMTCCCL